MKIKQIYLFLLLLISIKSFSQIETIINVPYQSGATPTYQALLKLPDDYGTTGAQTYALIIFAHGAGEDGPPISVIYNSSTAGGPAYYIEHGRWIESTINPKDGQPYKFIIVSPQAAATNWSISAAMVPFIVAYLEAHYRINTDREYYTGLSAGGEAFGEYAYHLGVTPTRLPAAIYLASQAGDNPAGQPWGATMIRDSNNVLGTGDTLNDIHGEFTNDLIKSMNAVRTGYAKFININTGGHGPWLQYDPAFTFNITWKGISYTGINIYQWMLLNSRATAPVTTPTANAGTNQSITQPANSVTLSGSGTAGTGHTISSYTWSETSGPSCTITNAGPSLTANSTTVTGMSTAGTYVFLLTVKNEINVTATSSVTITVISNSPVANAGGDQTITLPTNSITLDGSSSTGGITSYAWSQLSGPNTASITSPTASTTTVLSMIQGTYSFQLSLNSGASKDTVQIIVQPIQPCGPRNKYIETPNGDTALCDGCSAFNHAYQPGDTIVIPHNPTSLNYWQYITFRGLAGNVGCPIVIINDNVAQTLIKGQVQLDGCQYVKFVGTGLSSTQYGFKIEYDPVIVPQVIGGMIIFNRSKNVEITNVDVHNVGTGIVCETNNNCDQSLDYPNWVLDSIIVHDSRIRMTWNEGMYFANTSPDNAPYDLREDQGECAINASSPSYSLPMQNGYMHIYNMIVDSTGRGGIQMAGNGGTNVISEINNNIVTHSGLNQDDAQGTAISVGLYAKVYIHDNIMRNTYTWGFASLGGCTTNVPVRLENNTIDSCGFLTGWNRLSTTSDEFFNPAIEPHTTDTLPWPYAVEIDVKPRFYTFASTGNPPSPPPGAPYGTAVKGGDSTQFWIKNNRIGLTKAINRTPFSPGQRNVIQIFDYAPNPGIQKIGNIVCGNVFFNDTPALPWADSTVNNISYSSNCGAQPIVNAGLGQSITLPTTSVSLTGTASGTGGATISSTLWTLISGPATPTIVSSGSLTTSITGLTVAGTYVFNLKATDSNSAINNSTVQVTVISSVTPCNCITPLRKYAKKAIK